MVNQVLVDELVLDIQSGKKDLRECIEDLKDSLMAKSDKIDDLNYLIEELRVTLSNQEKEIDRLEDRINELKIDSEVREHNATM